MSIKPPRRSPTSIATSGPAAWKRVRVGETLRLVNGTAFKPTDWSADGLPIVRIQNLNNPDAPYNRFNGSLPDKFRLRGGELLFAWSGTPGTSFGAHIWRGEDAWLNQHIFNVLSSEDQWDKRFLRLAINQNLAEYIRAAHGGAGLAHITKGRFEESELPLPPLPEQRRIVAEIEKQFTRLDAGVAALKRVQANLKRYRAAVLKAACEGKLVPTEAELHKQSGSGVPPLASKTKGKRQEAASTFETGEQLLKRILEERRKNWSGRGKYKEPAAPDTTDLAPLPEGWAWATADQVSSHITDGEHIQPKYTEAGFPMLSAKHVRSGYVVFADVPTISKHDFDLCLKRCAPRKDDILIVCVGATTGRTAIVRESEPFALVRSVLLIRSLINPRFLLGWIQSPECQTWIQRASGSSAQAHLYIKNTKKMLVALPPLAEQARIVSEVERRLSVAEELEAAVAANLLRATRLRQAILQEAFTGELA